MIQPSLTEVDMEYQLVFKLGQVVDYSCAFFLLRRDGNTENTFSVMFPTALMVFQTQLNIDLFSYLLIAY